MDAMEKRVRVLEDLEAIKRLRVRYCYLADAAIGGDKSRYDELATHFAEDAWVEFEGFGVHRGRDAVARFFKEVVDPLWSYAGHLVMNPIIEVDGDKAAGTWFVHVTCTTRKSNRAVWVQGRYDEEYVRVEGRWKWQSIKFTPHFITPFDEGWAKSPIMSLV